MLDSFKSSAIRLVTLARTTEEKKALFERLEKEGREGIVFKRLKSLSVPGRPNSGGDWLKFKFYATASVVVCSHNGGKRSVEMSVWNTDKTVVKVET